MSIKSRRLFAILVITAMVLAMLPVSALAASATYHPAASTVSADPLTVKVGKPSEFTVVFRSLDGVKVTDTAVFWIRSSRGAETADDFSGATFSATTIDLSEDGEQVTAEAIGVDGTITFNVSSPIPGTAEIALYQNRYGDEPGKYTFSGLIGKQTITFTEVAEIEKPYFDDYHFYDDENDVTVVQAGQSFKVKGEVTSNDLPVSDQTVTFQYRKGTGGWITLGTAKTNVNGVATLTVSAPTKAGADYQYRTKVGTKNSEAAKVEVIAAAPYTIAAYADTVWAEVDGDANIRFILKDAHGNEIKANKLDVYNDDVDNINDAIAEIMTASIKDPDGKAVEDYEFTTDTDDKGYIRVSFTPTKEGKYTVTAKIAGTGLSAKTEVNTGVFEEITKVELKADPKILASKADDTVTYTALKIDVFDENDIKRTFSYPDYEDDFIFSTSDATLATVGRTDGLITVKKAASGVVTFTVVHQPTGLTSSVEVPIAGAPVSISADVETDGLTADVTLTLLDAKGIKADEGDDDTYTVMVPAGVTVDDQENFKDGVATFTLAADEYGTYTIQVVSDLGIAKTFDVTFGAPKPEVGANSLTLFIGSKGYVADGAGATSDAAPFIEDGRTFVPVRLIAEAFGAEADWTPKDAAVEVVTLTRDDIQITINIGAYTIDVVRDGVAETVPTDVAAFIKDGRTFLPFRVIAEAFGAEVDWGPKDGPTEWVTFTQ